MSQSTTYILHTVSPLNGKRHTAEYDTVKEATVDLNSAVRRFRDHFDNGGEGWSGADLEGEEKVDEFVSMFFYIEKVVTKSSVAKSAPARKKRQTSVEKAPAEPADGRGEALVIQRLLDREATGRVYQLEQYASRLGWREGEEVRKQLEDLLAELGETHELRRYYDGDSLRWLVFPKGFRFKGVEVTCYRKTETWFSRRNAMAFYAEAIECCEGCERDRYVNVFMQLGEGLDSCTDGMGV